MKVSERWGRFKKKRSAHLSFWLLLICFVTSLFSELICSSQPLLVKDGTWQVPLLKRFSPSVFRETGEIEVNYRERKNSWAFFPLIPFSPYESVTNLGSPPPTAPSIRNWMGTDDRGRDVFARLIYGFRSSFLFALFSLAGISIVGFLVGALQALRGGWFDFITQRVSEVFDSIPALPVILFVLSLISPSVPVLLLLWVGLSWFSVAGNVRAQVLRLKNLEFVIAARAQGMGASQIIGKHLFPHVITVLITLFPFILCSSITFFASLDFLGVGLSRSEPSWGELLSQAKENLDCWWLIVFPAGSLLITLFLLTLIGEGVRFAFLSKEAPVP